MLHLLRFGRYAWRFERAYKSNQWAAVKECFHDDATYTMVGAPPLQGVSRGAAEIVAGYERILDRMDRRFDRRIPGIRGWPRIGRDTLQFRWQVRYVKGNESFVLLGETFCRFRGNRIIELTDTMDDAGCRRAGEFMERFM